MSEERTKLDIIPLFADLVEHWERKCVALDRLVEDAKETASEETIARLSGKAGMARSMTVELKREIRKANSFNSMTNGPHIEPSLSRRACPDSLLFKGKRTIGVLILAMRVSLGRLEKSSPISSVFWRRIGALEKIVFTRTF